MIRKYWTVEIIRELEECKEDDDLLYYGDDIKKAYDSISQIVKSKSASYSIIGEALIIGQKDYYFSWTNKDCLHVTCIEDDDGSDETWDD